MSRFRLTIESNLNDVFLVSVVSRGVCERLGMSAAETSAVEVCAVEAVTNAIKHAYLARRGHEVSIEIRSHAERLDLYICDKGEQMPAAHAAKLLRGSRVFEFNPFDLTAIPEGGMGLQIIYQLMDEAVYSTEAGINCLRLTKFLKVAKPRGVPEALPDAVDVCLEPTHGTC
jgi:anti-sigma regulatory factor (Ser/Thr protein kinase)